MILWDVLLRPGRSNLKLLMGSLNRTEVSAVGIRGRKGGRPNEKCSMLVELAKYCSSVNRE